LEGTYLILFSSLVFVVKNWENSTKIEDSILEKIQ